MERTALSENRVFSRRLPRVRCKYVPRPVSSQRNYRFKEKRERETERKGVVLVVESRRTAALSRWRLLLARSGKSFRGTFKGSLNFRPTFDDGGGSTWPERLILSFYITPFTYSFSFFLSFSFSSAGSPGARLRTSR